MRTSGTKYIIMVVIINTTIAIMTAVIIITMISTIITMVIFMILPMVNKARDTFLGKILLFIQVERKIEEGLCCSYIQKKVKGLLMKVKIKI